MTVTTASAGQVSQSAAKIYDEFFVPALFGEWAGRLCDAAEIAPGASVLDVACGTGATTREVAGRVGAAGRVTGLDRNDGMLDVARHRSPQIEWVEGMAEELPFDDATFDVVLCQFGLMFFEDRAKALGEMRRVLRPGGRMAVSVWDDVENSPGYAQMIELIEGMFGSAPADALRAPFCLGDRKAVERLLETAGIRDATMTTVAGTARFASIREWASLDVRGWTLDEFIDGDGLEALIAAAEEKFSAFEKPDGSVAFPAPAHIAVWTCRAHSAHERTGTAH